MQDQINHEVNIGIESRPDTYLSIESNKQMNLQGGELGPNGYVQ